MFLEELEDFDDLVPPRPVLRPVVGEWENWPLGIPVCLLDPPPGAIPPVPGVDTEVRLPPRRPDPFVPVRVGVMRFLRERAEMYETRAPHLEDRGRAAMALLFRAVGEELRLCADAVKDRTA